MLLQGCDYISCGQLPRRQFCRIQPDPHGVLALAKDHDVTHARDALQCIFYIDIQIVRDVLIRKTIVRRIESSGKDEVRVRLGDGHAGVLDFLGQPSLRGRDPILHVHRRDVQIIAGAEGYVDAAGAVVRTGRGNVMHALDSVDLLLQRNRNCRLHHLRIRAYIVAADRDLRRSQVGVEGNRQCGNADRARQNDQQGANGRKNRPLNEKINQCNSRFSPPLAAAELK